MNGHGDTAKVPVAHLNSTDGGRQACVNMLIEFAKTGNNRSLAALLECEIETNPEIDYDTTTLLHTILEKQGARGQESQIIDRLEATNECYVDMARLSLKIARNITDRGGMIDCLNSRGETPLILAATVSNRSLKHDLLMGFLDLGADATVADVKGSTALALVVREALAVTAKKMIEKIKYTICRILISNVYNERFLPQHHPRTWDGYFGALGSFVLNVHLILTPSRLKVDGGSSKLYRKCLQNTWTGLL